MTDISITAELFVQLLIERKWIAGKEELGKVGKEVDPNYIIFNVKTYKNKHFTQL